MMEMVAVFADIVGIAGVILLLIAYYLLNTGKMSASSMSYQIYNLLGALFILFSLMFSWNLSSALIETAWVFISFIGIYRSRQISLQENN